MVCGIRGGRWGREGGDPTVPHMEFFSHHTHQEWMVSRDKMIPTSLNPSLYHPFSLYTFSSGGNWMLRAGFGLPGCHVWVTHLPKFTKVMVSFPTDFPGADEVCCKPRNPISISFYPFILFDSRSKDCETFLHCLASERIYILLHRSYFFPSVFMTMDSESEGIKREINMYTWEEEITLLTKAASMPQLKTGPCSYAAHR